MVTAADEAFLWHRLQHKTHLDESERTFIADAEQQLTRLLYLRVVGEMTAGCGLHDSLDYATGTPRTVIALSLGQTHTLLSEARMRGTFDGQSTRESLQLQQVLRLAQRVGD